MKREVTVDRVVQASFPAAEGVVEGIVRQIDGARCLVEWDHGVSEWYSLRAVSAMKEPAMSPQKRRPARTSGPVDPYAGRPRKFPSRGADLAQLGVRATTSPDAAPFELKRRAASGSKPEHVSLVARPRRGEAPWVAHRALGHGAFGAVFDVTLRTEARPRVALKICFAGARRFGIEREIEVLAEVSRRRPSPKTAPVGGLAELETFYAYRDASAVAMRLADTTLSDLAKGLRGVAMRFSEPVALFYAIGTLEAVDALHSTDFLHADVKPDNLCLTYGEPDDVVSGKPVDAIAAAGYRVTLIDYSLAVDLRAYENPDQRFVSGADSPAQVPEYCWPPALKDASWRREIDLYAVGRILYQVAAGSILTKTLTSTNLETRLPRGWNRRLWADVLAKLIDADESVDLGALARTMRRHLEKDVLAGDTAKLVEALDHHRRLVTGEARRGADAAATRVKPMEDDLPSEPPKLEPRTVRVSPSPTQPARGRAKRPRAEAPARSSRRARAVVSYAEPKGNAKLRNSHGVVWTSR